MLRLFACLLSAVIAGACLIGTAFAVEQTVEQARTELRSINQGLIQLGRVIHLVHEVVAPSVVAVRTKERQARRTWTQVEVREVEVGEGSGFIFHSDAKASYVLTNAHVVYQVDRDQTFIRDAANQAVGFDRVRVLLSDNREVDAVYVGGDTQADLAVLRLDIPNLPAVEWGDSDRSQVGDWVVALGYPFGVGYSATVGNVSATDRSTGVYESNHGFESFIQTDASINPGNSGGPLVNIDGKIIGVNSNIVSRSGGSVGLGFAIPSRLARRVAEDLVQFGTVQRGMIGVQMEELTADQAAGLGLPAMQTVRIAGVIPLSPAAEAGAKQGDLLQSVDDQKIRSQHQFRARLAAFRPGQPVRLGLWREGKAITLTMAPIAQAELEKRLSAAAVDAGEAPRGQGVAWPAFGLRLADDDQAGLVVVAVDAGSVADRAGLVRGDRVLGERKFGSLDDLAGARQLATAKEVQLLVARRDGRHYWIRMSRR